ncbi:MAG: hypothetical protein GQ581_03670 [Methyloprofundus sp.]|nr:hypothetical protein [Methyloprofundus sp.]
MAKPDWNRQGHAGLAFNFKTKSLLIFGSDSHGENWDNQVHEFNLLSMKWVDHYPASLLQSYRSDRDKNRVAGIGGLFPWAIHAYDNVAYIPEMDALMVTSRNNNHTPSPNKQAAEAEFDPSWVYDLISEKWKILPIKNPPAFFAGASSYDPNTKSLWAYQQWGFWQFDILFQKWRKVPGKHNVGLTMHFTMVTDTKRHQLLFFGNARKTNNIWAYTPASLPQQMGTWEIRQVEGDFCPEDEHLPVAYDKHQDAFLLLPDEDVEKSVTLVYLPEENRYVRITGADMPANGMNYMMEYDPYHRVFLLVTGSEEMGLPLRVWAFRLNLQTLNQNLPVV